MDMNVLCEVCGKRPAVCTHHLIFGWGMRELADEDGLTIRLCAECHNVGQMSIHNNTSAEKLSKKIGQMMWERNFIFRKLKMSAEEEMQIRSEARECFRKRYGESFL